jgi:hypothetical protein
MQVHNLKYGMSGEVRFGRYASGELAIAIVNDGEMQARATVCLEGWGVDAASDGHVWVKTWSENEGMDRALADAGVIERHFVDEAWGGYDGKCRAVLAKLTPAALAELATQET